MRRLHLALQGYEALATALQLQLDEANSDRAEDWLREEVCPACQELVEHCSFQLAARWSVDHLEPGVQTPERALVEATDAALVRLATALTAATTPDGGQESQGSLVGTATNRVGIPAQSHETLAWVAGRPWFDLVSPEEYFHAECGLHLNQSHVKQTRRFRAVRELRVPLGDYVSRSLFARIDFWNELLQSQWNKVFLSSKLNPATSERLFAAKVALDQSIERLKEACFTGNGSRLREAATTLTQVYAAYAFVPRLDWLGFPHGSAKSVQGLVRSVIRRRGTARVIARDEVGFRLLETRPASLCDATVLRHIASALDEARVFYEAPQDADDLVEWTKDRVRLLLVDRSPRQAYWDGVAIASNEWDSLPNEWNLLWILARNLGRVADQEMLIKPDGEAIRSRRSRLSRLLSESASQLDFAIETLRGQGYRLQLSAEDVVLLRDDGTGQLVEERSTLTCNR